MNFISYFWIIFFVVFIGCSSNRLDDLNVQCAKNDFVSCEKLSNEYINSNHLDKLKKLYVRQCNRKNDYYCYKLANFYILNNNIDNGLDLHNHLCTNSYYASCYELANFYKNTELASKYNSLFHKSCFNENINQINACLVLDSYKNINATEQLCELRDHRACLKLARAYERNELGLEYDYIKAAQYYTKACVSDEIACAEANNFKNSLGLEYALKCQNNNKFACYELAKLYGNNLQMLENSCKDEVYDACIDLYDYYNKSADFQKAMFYATKACTNSKYHCYELANIYLNKDFDYATYLLNKSCNDSNAKSCLQLANIYEKDSDYEVYYHLKACEFGMYESCNKVAYYYENGIVLSKNINKAYDLYEYACSNNFADACYEQAIALELGLGIKQDLQRAKYIYKKACDLGNDYACRK